MNPELTISLVSFRPEAAISWKTVNMVTYGNFSTFRQVSARIGLSPLSVKAKVSTDGSGEESSGPRVTLSFLIPSLPNGPPDTAKLALNTGSNGLRLAKP